MEVAHQTVLDTKSGAFLETRVQLTQEEVRNVHQTAEPNADLLLRRLSSWRVLPRGAGEPRAPGIPSVATIQKRWTAQGILPLHQSLIFHAMGLQIYAFSGGDHDDSEADLYYPLWLSLMLVGRGLRRMTLDTSRHAEKLLGTLGVPAPDQIGRFFVSDPRRAYRLGLFQLALDLKQADENPDELSLRIDLALRPFNDEALAKIEQVAGQDKRLRISLLSSASAYAAKQGKSSPAVILAELEDWVKEIRPSVTLANAPLYAQVINAINLIHLIQGNAEAIARNMDDLLTEIVPQIGDPERRAHIEGNAYYQRSILARKRGDHDAEINSLVIAMGLDQHFGTLYYRMAQHFHDRGDSQAGIFYEMALALSPIDLATANDYGCFLADSGQTHKFESWSAFCRALFPEQFTDTEEAAT